MIYILNVIKHAKLSARIFYLIATSILVLYVGVLWLFKLDEFPGLHGDEAWFGLRAIDNMENGIHDLHGMTNYTGILQSSISYFVFKIWGVGVQQLRIGGAVFNLLGLIIIVANLIKSINYKAGLIFVLLIAQSTFYNIYPRLAWEVASFNLFFVSILYYSITEFFRVDGRFKELWLAVFLLANLLGAYNHILFSCLGIAAFTGTFFWAIYTKAQNIEACLSILFINVINLICLYYFMNFWAGNIYVDDWTFLILAVVLLVFLTLEVCFYGHIKSNFIGKYLVSGTSKFVLIPILLVFGTAIFISFHGWSFFLVICNYVPLIRFFSFVAPKIQTVFYCLNATIICGVFIFFLIKDFLRSSPFPYLFAAYFGLINVYTTHPYDRYYLSIFIFMCIYLAYKLSLAVKFSVWPLLSFVIVVLMNASVFVKIKKDPNRLKRAMRYMIGWNTEEYSGHFLPVKPLVEIIKKNKISNVKYTSQQYFIEMPILFYKEFDAWPESSRDTLVVDYDNAHLGNGFKIQIKKAE